MHVNGLKKDMLIYLFITASTMAKVSRILETHCILPSSSTFPRHFVNPTFILIFNFLQRRHIVMSSFISFISLLNSTNAAARANPHIKEGSANRDTPLCFVYDWSWRIFMLLVFWRIHSFWSFPSLFPNEHYICSLMIGFIYTLLHRTTLWTQRGGKSLPLRR